MNAVPIRRSPISVLTSHHNRVKRIDVARDEPSLFWSAAEDDLVL